jgi:phospholipase D1/2
VAGPLPADQPPPRRFKTGTLLRFLVLPALLLAGFALLRWTPLGHQFTAERLAASIAGLQRAWWAPAVLIAGYAVLSPLGVPATPLMLAGGVVFGAVYGSLYNVLGVWAGAATTYSLGRLLGRDFVVQVAGKRLKKVERAVSKRGFWGLVGVRFLPLPFAVVNYCAALAGVRPGLFCASTALGTAPTVSLYSYVFAALAHAGAAHRQAVYWQIAGFSILLVTLIAAPQIWQARRRRARYRALRELRELRRQSAGA